MIFYRIKFIVFGGNIGARPAKVLRLPKRVHNVVEKVLNHDCVIHDRFARHAVALVGEANHQAIIHRLRPGFSVGFAEKDAVNSIGEELIQFVPDGEGLAFFCFVALRLIGRNAILFVARKQFVRIVELVVEEIARPEITVCPRYKMGQRISYLRVAPSSLQHSKAGDPLVSVFAYS